MLQGHQSMKIIFAVTITQLKYHVSWDWLLPVWRKWNDATDAMDPDYPTGEAWMASIFTSPKVSIYDAHQADT